MDKKSESRHGGRPTGWRKPEGTREQKQMRAYPDEWDLIQRFAKLVKYGDKAACINFLNEQEQSK
ncbi:MAG: hypothetical protein IKP64_09705 [Selenomonadaceae bacterium]|nr:hypothetical protein [Selenomonadaceae bacterium]MBR4383818.1 hypothetical protein [Selenomonadaceae bacterium]